MGSQRVGHDWATFTFTFNSMAFSFLFPVVRYLSNMFYIIYVKNLSMRNYFLFSWTKIIPRWLPLKSSLKSKRVFSWQENEVSKYFQDYTASQRLSLKLKSCDWQPVCFGGWQSVAHLFENSSQARSTSSAAAATFILGSLWSCQHPYCSCNIILSSFRWQQLIWALGLTHSKMFPAPVLNLAPPNTKLLELHRFGMKSCLLKCRTCH